MSDQAARLRLLVGDESSPEDSAPPRAWRTLTIVGGKGGVGASTVALNLAVALSMCGCRVELADAMERDVAAPSPGPAGIVFRHAEAWADLCLPSRSGSLLPQTEAPPDWLVVDAGRGNCNPPTGDTSSLTLVVTTPEPLAILATFATLRSMSASGVTTELVVNRSYSQRDSALIQARIQETSRRLLGSCPRVHALSEDPAVIDATRYGRPVVLACPASPFSRGVQRLVDGWTSAIHARAA